MVVYLESFLEKHTNSKYLFKVSMIETGPNNIKATWSDKLRKIVWVDPEFRDALPELDDDGGIGTHSNRKFAADTLAKRASGDSWRMEGGGREASDGLH
jgi:hypothetical protein